MIVCLSVVNLWRCTCLLSYDSWVMLKHPYDLEFNMQLRKRMYGLEHILATVG